MKIIILVFAAVLAVGIIFLFNQRSQNLFLNMKITSPAFENNQPIPGKYTCDGEDINPPLIIEDAPAGTKSLALILDDPDSPMRVFNHWLLWNISPETKEIKENSAPAEAVSGTNTFGKLEYGGPCPSSGAHRYQFKLFALDSELSLPRGAKKEDLLKAMNGHILDQSEFVGRYSRRK